MDSLFASLAPLKKKKRTTYNKVSTDVNENKETTIDNDPPLILGSGFLFNNPTLSKVKNRLNGDDLPDDNNSNNENEIFQTQNISNFYSGGEDLEQLEIEEKLSDNVNFTKVTEKSIISEVDFMQTQTTQIIPNDNQTQLIDEYQVQSFSQTQLIIPDGSKIQTETTLNVLNTDSHINSETQTINNKSQIINESDNETMPQFSQNLENFNLKIDRQLDISNATEEYTQHIEVSNQTTTQIDTSVNETRTQIDSEKTQTIFNKRLSQDMDSQPQTFQQTLKDTQSNLKIHEIQKELEIERLNDEKQRMVEHKKPQKKTITILNFSKESFLADFDESDDSRDDSENQIKEKDSNTDRNANPDTTSQIAKQNSTKSSGFKFKGLRIYETALKKEVTSAQFINLDEDDNTNICDTSKTSHASKATLLNIKARLSKNNPVSKISKRSKPTLNKLFNSLMQASRKQIVDHRREVIESKGLIFEDIEKEKEQVENLLEQEILRNKRIRKREKEKEISEEKENEIDFDFSDNELEESDVTDEETAIEADISESEEQEVQNEQEDKSDEDEELKTVKTRNIKATHIVEDSDTGSEFEEENDTAAEETGLRNRNVINLGHYGDNLDSDSADLETYNTNDKTDQVNEQDLEARIEFVKEEKKKILDKERKLQKEREEMKRKGINKFVEEEAEESEDEWYGIGGADGETSDQYDSEVEKMIDDYSKTNLNPGEIRELLMEENKEMDIKLVEKILYDLKNGGLRKRGRANLDLELSDDEDDDLRNYRIRKRELMEQRRLDLGQDKLVKNPKSKAFFESMVEDIIEVKNPFANENTVEIQTTTTDLDTNVAQQEEDEDATVLSKGPKKFTLSEDFVQRSLSFLTDSNKDLQELENDKHLSRIQHGKGVDDLVTLKNQSSIKSFKSINSSNTSLIDLENGNTTNDVNEKENNEDADSLAQSRFRHPSILKLFGSREDINDKFKEGNKTVRTSKSYKTVGSAKASITYLGKSRKLVAPKKKNRSFLIGGGRRSKLNKLFNSQDDSFDA